MTDTMNDYLILKAPATPSGQIIVHEGDCINGDFLKVGQVPYAEKCCTTIAATGNKIWVVVKDECSRQSQIQCSTE